MSDNRIQVVWVCAFSNPEVRQHYSQRINPLLKVLLKIIGRFTGFDKDYAIWDTNAIKEFESFPDFELHVICPIRYLSKKVVEFDINGVHYHLFRDQHSGLLSQVYYQLVDKYSCRFERNRIIIHNLIEKIHPKIVHVIGAENPFYSLSALDVSRDSVLIVQLQTLLMRLVNVTDNPKQKRDFSYKGALEKELFERTDYIGTTVKLFRDYLLDVNPNYHFLDIGLAMGPTVNEEITEKEYDFVYFSANIKKAGLEALKAFVLAQKKNPNITLDIVGQYDYEYKQELDKIIEENGVRGRVFFEGFLPTHEDVIRQIKKARFALLPLKMDLVPNTIIEAMSNGLVVVTTITKDGTPELNRIRECVLLSEQNDFQSMADNMTRLVNDAIYAEYLRHNSFHYIQSLSSNHTIMLKWREAYLALV